MTAFDNYDIAREYVNLMETESRDVWLDVIFGERKSLYGIPFWTKIVNEFKDRELSRIEFGNPPSLGPFPFLSFLFTHGGKKLVERFKEEITHEYSEYGGCPWWGLIFEHWTRVDDPVVSDSNLSVEDMIFILMAGKENEM